MVHSFVAFANVGSRYLEPSRR